MRGQLAAAIEVSLVQGLPRVIGVDSGEAVVNY